MPNADKSKPGFDRLPICLGMREHIDHYLQQYPNKCRRLTSAAWSQELNQLFIWCIGTGHLKGGAIWLANNAMMSKGWVDKKLKGNLANDGDEVFVTASEACFWNDTLGKPFPLSGKDKARQKAETKSKGGK